MATKDTLDACRIRFVEGALAKLERELENAEGSHKEALRALQEWLADVQQRLRKHGRHTFH